MKMPGVRLQDELRAVTLQTQAAELREQGRWPQAEAAAREAVRLFARLSGKNSPDAAHALVELGRVREGQGVWKEARRCYADAAGALAPHARRRGAEEDVRRLYVQTCLFEAKAREALGEYEAAEGAYAQAQSHAHTLLGRKDLLAAAALNGLGVLYKATGRYVDAHKAYRQALPIVRAQGGPADEASVYHNLGGIAHARGRLGEAERHARRGVAMRKEALGPRHPDVVADEAALATILEERGKRDEAERLLRAAVTFFRRRLGPKSYEVAVNLGTLGNLYRNQGDLPRAERYLRDALEAEEAALGRGHPELVFSLNNLAVVLAARGSTAEARRVYRRALGVLDKSVGKTHPHYEACLDNLRALEQESATNGSRATRPRRKS